MENAQHQDDGATPWGAVRCFSRLFRSVVAMADSVGPLAMINCKPRQARKGATVAVKSCAEVRLAEDVTISAV